MDPKSIANLDPKLRETYTRVMGTTSTGPASPENAAVPTSLDTNSGLSAPVSPPSPAAATPTPPDFSSPVMPEPQLPSSFSELSTPSANIPQPSSFTPADLGLSTPVSPSQPAEMQPLTSPATAAQTTQSTGALIRVLYIIGGMVFFVVYVFFWVKIFNYQLPF